MLPPNLKRLDENWIPADKNEIRLFGVVRNENLRLPYFLDYYRRLGVGRFFIVDNDSKDGTTEFLLAQLDCCVFHTAGSYGATRAGLSWLNPLMNEYGEGHWIILADADEILVYPHCEKRKLPEFCAWLDRHEYQGIFTLLLDMYSSCPLNQVNYERGEKFIDICNYFDRDYFFVRRIGLPFLKPAFPEVEPIGGPRLRLCYPGQNTRRLWPRLRVKLARRFARLFSRNGRARVLGAEAPAPQAFKIPLVKWKRGFAFVTSHRLNPIQLAPVTGALLHFKYFQDFSARIQDAVERNAHFDNSSEYMRYGELLSKDPALSMVYEGSVIYTDSASLLQLRLMMSCPEWESQGLAKGQSPNSPHSLDMGPEPNSFPEGGSS
jgi:glycosyltransferase involved in cell wall biosynthesis